VKCDETCELSDSAGDSIFDELETIDLGLVKIVVERLIVVNL
jgi:hypothetical protein